MSRNRIRVWFAVLCVGLVAACDAEMGDGATGDDEPVASGSDELVTYCTPTTCPNLKLDAVELNDGVTPEYSRDVPIHVSTTGYGVTATRIRVGTSASNVTTHSFQAMSTTSYDQLVFHSGAARGTLTLFVQVEGFHAASGQWVTSNIVSASIDFIPRASHTIPCFDAYNEARTRDFIFSGSAVGGIGSCTLRQADTALYMVTDGYLWDDVRCRFHLFQGRSLKQHWAIEEDPLMIIEPQATWSYDFPDPLPPFDRTRFDQTVTDHKKSWELGGILERCIEVTLTGPEEEDWTEAFRH